METQVKDSPLEWMRTMVTEWLDAPDTGSTQLIEWCRGWDMPPVGARDEPYVWLLRALPSGGDRWTEVKRFSKRVSQVLEQQPDVNCPEPWGEQVLYNLLYLCAGLRCAEILWEPLKAMLERAREKDSLAGEWEGIALGRVLRTALICNQADRSLRETWLSILRGEEDAVLGDNKDAAIDGVRLMGGEPDLDAAGEALKCMALELEETYEKRPVFRAFIERIKASSPGRPTWNRELIEQADVNNWPVWAVECLDLYERTNCAKKGQARLFLWRWIFDAIERQNNCDVCRSYCNDTVKEVLVREGSLPLIAKIAPLFEHARLGNPFPSSRSMLGAIMTAMSEAEMLLKAGAPHVVENTSMAAGNEHLNAEYSQALRNHLEAVHRENLDEVNVEWGEHQAA